MTTAEDRAVGALLGLAAGDAVGTTVEFAPPGSFPPVTDMVGDGPFGLKPGQWTDDTSMALCLAESLVDTGRMDLVDQLRRYVLWRDEGHLSSTGRCFDIGGTTTAQLTRFTRTGEPVDPSPDQESCANGSLMRLAPVPIRWHGDVEEAAARSAESSRTTHAAERPVDTCRLLGAIVAALIGGTPVEEVLDPGFWTFGPLHPQVEAIAHGSWRDKEPPEIRGTGFCIDALEAALWAVGGAADFRDAVLRATNLGDDADTTAAIAGQLAGARWGASGIPEPWRQRLVLRPRITELARQLFAAGGGALDDPARWPHDDLQHAYWVRPGSLLAGEYPGALADPVEAAARVNLLVDAGVRSFVDLTEPQELDPYDEHVARAGRARALDLDHRRFPIPDFSIVADDIYDEIVAHIDRAQARGAVFIHCWGGRGRTGTVVGCMLAREGHTYESIIDTIKGLRAGTSKARYDSPEADSQHDLLRRLVARLHGT